MSDLNHQLTEVLPHLHRFALKLARSEDRADDLVQDCIERALRKAELYEPGTNLRAWLFTMMRNQFINGVRRDKVAHRYRETVKIEAPRSTAPCQITHIFLNQTMTALAGLGVEEREAVRLIAIEEQSHQQAGDASAHPVGTMKSRLFRARIKLRARMALDQENVMGSGGELDVA